MRRSDRILQIGVVGLIALCTYLLLPPLRSITTTSIQTGESYPGLFAVVESLQDLLSQTEIVVIGQITPTSDIVNGARNPDDITQPHSEIFIVGKVYRVDVESYIRGQGGNVLFIVQPESWLELETTLTPNAYERGKGVYNAIIPKANTRYLLFLRRSESFPNQQYYAGAIHPWRFDASDPNRVVPEDPWTEAIQYFPAQPLATIIQQVQGAPVRAPTPKPTTESGIFKRQYAPDRLETKPGGED